MSCHFTKHIEFSSISETIYDFLYRIVSFKNQKTYNYLLTWLAKLWKYGKTKTALVLLGSKGIGKSTFTYLATQIMGEENVSVIPEFKQLRNKFNNFLHKKALIVVEEIAEESRADKATQNTLKTLITDDYLKIELKGVNSFQTNNTCNFIICSNYDTPVEITEDNRRFVFLQVSEEEKQKSEYFSTLHTAMKNEEVIQKIRRYLNDCVETPDSLPILNTDKEAELKAHSRSSADVYVFEILSLPCEGKEFGVVYNEYQKWCKNNCETEVS